LAFSAFATADPSYQHHAIVDYNESHTHKSCFCFLLFTTVWTSAAWYVRDNCYPLLVTPSEDTNWSAVLRCRLAFLHLDFLQFLGQSLHVYSDVCHPMCCTISETWPELQNYNNFPSTRYSLCGAAESYIIISVAFDVFLGGGNKARVQNGFISSIEYEGLQITRKWFA